MSKVIIYSTETCPWCIKVKEFLKENKIPFTNKDVGSNQKNAKEMIEKSGQQGVPVVDIGGKIIVGFNEEKIKKALGI
jgi:glutaredoxin-like YruB-family protein|tara:strand:+ start:2940 stop:3173 length:234 start_codon:yes stop_codon:yes gene_type:complete